MQSLFSGILLISALGLIISVLLQESNEGGIGAIGGNSPESLFGKNRSSSKDAILQRSTIISAAVFVISTLVLAAS
ncbi:MAG TPA: preprotein translocase subunit SecG [Tissierellaceae bacterium]|nr:preprotein translocase subunit SecG [Tissierellaceae bacterium]